jgi:SH3 domain protein
MSGMMRSVFLAGALAASLGAQGAQKAYVTDKLEVQLRSGPSLQHKIVKMVPSGTAVTILYTDEANGYNQVSTESGEQGWILSRYLTGQPVARIQMEENAKRVTDLGEENKTLKAELAQVRSGKDSAEKSTQELNTETNRLNSELISVRQASANALQIQSERDQLQEKVIALERELETTKREKQSLDDSNKQDWFLIGAGVLFGGISLGLILPRLSWRKRASWDSF